jgi:hypothetical protein
LPRAPERARESRAGPAAACARNARVWIGMPRPGPAARVARRPPSADGGVERCNDHVTAAARDGRASGLVCCADWRAVCGAPATSGCGRSTEHGARMLPCERMLLSLHRLRRCVRARQRREHGEGADKAAAQPTRVQLPRRENSAGGCATCIQHSAPRLRHAGRAAGGLTQLGGACGCCCCALSSSALLRGGVACSTHPHRPTPLSRLCACHTTLAPRHAHARAASPVPLTLRCTATSAVVAPPLFPRACQPASLSQARRLRQAALSARCALHRHCRRTL